MTVPPSARWSVYALGAALTLAAVVWVSDADDGAGVVQPAARSVGAPAAGPRTAAAQAGPSAAALAQPVLRQPQEPNGDPFAVVGAVPDEAAASPAAAALPRVRLAPSAPPLPFIYLGSWIENGKTSVFVQREDRSYKVSGPGPLDADYAVRSVDDNGITFNYLPLGIVQELRFDAAPNVAPAVAAAAAPGGTPEPEQSEN